MDTLLGWLLALLILFTAYPWSVWLAARLKWDDFCLTMLLSLALSTGALSLVMFWQALAGVRLTLWGVTLPYLALMLPGLWLSRRQNLPWPAITLPTGWPARLALALMLMIGAGVLFNSLYWPFSREDTIGIYARFGAAMYTSRALVELPAAGTYYEAYPILIPLTYTYAYLASGWQNEFLARLFPALLSLGALAAVFTLGRTLHSARAGWVAALLLAITPAFTNWASSGYVDLPMAFFYTLAALFAWRLWETGSNWDALLAGTMMGLAAWTKNAALVGLGLMVIWLLWAELKRRLGWRQIALALAACGLIAAPWYARNLLVAGLIIPPTVWTDEARQTFNTLFVLITHIENYSVAGPLIVVSTLAAGAETLWRRLNPPAFVLLLLWTVPFYIVWWVFASYDPRFILLFLPLLCVLTGIQMARLWDWLSHAWQQRLLRPLALVAVVLALVATWNSVEYKDNLLRNPLMSVEERRMTAIRERQPKLYARWYGQDATPTPTAP